VSHNVFSLHGLRFRRVLRRPITTHRHIPGTDAGFPAVNKLTARGIVRAKQRGRSKVGRGEKRIEN